MNKIWWNCGNDFKINDGDSKLIILGGAKESKIQEEIKLGNETGKWGSNGSKTPIDALSFRRGSQFYYCDLEVFHCELLEDPFAGRVKEMIGLKRTHLSGIDASVLLRNFAKRVALDIAQLWNPPSFILDYLNSDNEDLCDRVRDFAFDIAYKEFGNRTNPIQTEVAFAIANLAYSVNTSPFVAADVIINDAINILAKSNEERLKVRENYNNLLEKELKEKMGI